MFTTNSVLYQESYQKHNEVIDINNNWYLGEPLSHEEGAREKFKIICPQEINHKFLISGHKYMFKKSNKRKGHHFQFWGEIIAYKIGKICGIKTVPAFVAKIREDENIIYGSISEWYFNYPQTQRQFYKIPGGDLFTRLIANFERKKGNQHNIKSFKDSLSMDYLEIPFTSRIQDDIKLEFAKILLLDAIIGNTDRHQDNWEIIHRGHEEAYISPAFDNGTSLGYDILEENIPKKLLNIDSYINGGTHHIKENIEDNKGIKFIDTIRIIIDELSIPKQKVASILDVDISQIKKEISYLQKFDIGKYSLSNERVDLIFNIIYKRINLFKEML